MQKNAKKPTESLPKSSKKSNQSNPNSHHGLSARKLTDGICGILKVTVVGAENLPRGKHLFSALIGGLVGPYMIYHFSQIYETDHLKIYHTIFLALAVFCVFQFFNGLRRSGIFSGLMWDSSFVVISYGWNTYRTKETSTRQDPVWNETLPVLIKQDSIDYSLVISVYGKKLLNKNQLLGTCKLSLLEIIQLYKLYNNVGDLNILYGENSLQNLLAKLSKQNKADGSHCSIQDELKRRQSEKSETSSESNFIHSTNFLEYETSRKILRPNRRFFTEMGDIWIPLLCEDGKGDAEEGIPELHLRLRFVDAASLQKKFWFWIFEQFDTDENKKISRLELGAIFEAVGSDVSDESIDNLFGEREEIEMDELYEMILFRNDWIQRDKEPTPSHKPAAIPRIGSFLFKTCPICKSALPVAYDEVIFHLAICTEGSSFAAEKFMLGGFITEANASRGWVTRLGTYLTLGKYRLGEVSGNILVQVRGSGEVIEEKMPGYIRLGMRVLFQSRAGSSTFKTNRIQKLVKSMTIKQGHKFNSPSSVMNILPFIQFHNINIKEMAASSISEFRTFNEFFYRKLKPSARILAAPQDPHVAVCPADSRCIVFTGVDAAREFWIKGANFSLGRLFQDADLEGKFQGGSLAIFRLAPQDYHRFHMPVNGKFHATRSIDGSYYTVNPMAVRENIDVFTDNIRSVSEILSPEFGSVAYVCIGAMMVGSVCLTASLNDFLSRMDEFGYFAFGGSTVILVFQPNSILFDPDLLDTSKKSLETLVQVGMSLGKACG